MRIRRNASRTLGSAFFTAQPEAPQPEAVLLPPPPSPPPALSAYVASEDAVVPEAAPMVVCALNCQWTAHPDAVNPKERNDDPGGGGWREPRETPGLAYKSVAFELLQQEIEANTKKKQQQPRRRQVKKRKKAAGKMKQDAADQRRKRMKAKLIMKEVVSNGEASDDGWRCKKSDGRKWYCQNRVARPNTLCDYHLSQSRSYYKPGAAAAPGSSSKSAPVKSSASKAAPVKASASSKPTPVTAAVSSKAASASEPTSSKATSAGALSSSKRSRKKKVVADYLGEAFYYYELFGPFRGKQRGNPSSSDRVEDGTTEAPEGDGSAKPREQDGTPPEAQEQDGTPSEPQDDNDEDYAPPVSNSKPRAENRTAVANLSFTRMARTKRVKVRLLKSLP